MVVMRAFYVNDFQESHEQFFQDFHEFINANVRNSLEFGGRAAAIMIPDFYP